MGIYGARRASARRTERKPSTLKLSTTSEQAMEHVKAGAYEGHLSAEDGAGQADPPRYRRAARRKYVYAATIARAEEHSLR